MRELTPLEKLEVINFSIATLLTEAKTKKTHQYLSMCRPIIQYIVLYNLPEFKNSSIILYRNINVIFPEFWENRPPEAKETVKCYWFKHDDLLSRIAYLKNLKIILTTKKDERKI